MLGFMAQGTKSEGIESFLKYYVYREENKKDPKLPTLFCVLCTKAYRANSSAKRHFFQRHLKRSVVYEDIRFYPCSLDHILEADTESPRPNRTPARIHYHCPLCLKTTRCERLGKHMEIHHGVNATFDKEYIDLTWEQFHKKLDPKLATTQYNHSIASFTKLNAIASTDNVKPELLNDETSFQEMSFSNEDSIVEIDNEISGDEAEVEHLRHSLPEHLAQLLHEPLAKRPRQTNEEDHQQQYEVTVDTTSTEIESNKHSVKMRDLMEELFRIKSSIRRLNSRVADTISQLNSRVTNIEEQIFVIMDQEQPNNDQNYGTKDF